MLMLAFSFMSGYSVYRFGCYSLSGYMSEGCAIKAYEVHVLMTLLHRRPPSGTRQFGIAIIVGLVLSWPGVGRENRLPIRFILTGLLIPVLAAAAQFYVGFGRPASLKLIGL